MEGRAWIWSRIVEGFMANVEIIHEVREGGPDWNLSFQWCRYHYDDASPDEMGYRFIWRDPDGNLRSQRGQACIQSAAQMFRLISLAIQDGWFITAET